MKLEERPRPRNDAIIPRDEVEALIAEGRTIVIVDGDVLKVDAWLPYHPGGDKAVRHMAGRDATDEVTVLHSADTKRRMKNFKIGRIEGQWQNFIPPIQGGRFRTREQQQAEREGSPTKEDEQLDRSSPESSEAPSPVFDAPDSKSSQVRRRRTEGKTYSRASSMTSVSSVELDAPNAKPELSHVDVNTGHVLDLDAFEYPSLEPEVQADIVRKYRQLNERIKAEGLYQCRYTDYLREAIRWSILFGTFLFFFQRSWYMTSAVFLGLFWHQLVFTAHDAGHLGITHDYTIDTVLGIIITDFLGGLSLGWWKRNHNVHHIVTNSPEHDPDIQHVPFFAITSRFFENLTSTYYDCIMAYDVFARFFIKYQQHLYYPVLAFGRFNLYFLSWGYLIRGQAPKKGPAAWTRWFELIGQAFFWTWFGYGIVYRGIPTGWQRFLFVLVSHLVTSPVHVQITLSHFAMSTRDVGPAESFPQKMLRTTMDVECPAWLDFVHGGLQFQAVHHLFPRIPRHNLRRAQGLIQEFCNDVGIPYAMYGFVDGNKRVLGRMADVGRQAKILAECQRQISKSTDFGMH